MNATLIWYFKDEKYFFFPCETAIQTSHQAAPSPKIEPTRRLRVQNDRPLQSGAVAGASARIGSRSPRSLHFPRLPIARRAEEGQGGGKVSLSFPLFIYFWACDCYICFGCFSWACIASPRLFLSGHSCNLPLRWFPLHVRRTTGVVAATPMAWAQEQRIEEHFGRFLCFDEDSERYHNPSRIKLELCRCSVSVSLHRYLLWIFCEIDRTRKRFRDSQSDFIVYAISPNGL